MPACRHGKEAPCEWCYSQDYFWNGSKNPTERKATIATIRGEPFRVLEGDTNAERHGLTMRPGSVLLAELVSDVNPLGLTVLELGAGLGLPGRVAAWLGADVTFAEADKAIAVCVGDELAQLEAVRYRFHTGPWSELPKFDMIVGSEILYDVRLIRESFDLVREKWTGRGPVMFVDPGRRRHEIRREAPLKGLHLEYREVEGKMMDGARFVCDLWEMKPTIKV